MSFIISGNYGDIYDNGDGTVYKQFKDFQEAQIEIIISRMTLGIPGLIKFIKFVDNRIYMKKYDMDLEKLLKNKEFFDKRNTEEGIKIRREMIINLLTTLAKLHHIGLNHGDLSIYNILLDRKDLPNLTITDLGNSGITGSPYTYCANSSFRSPDKTMSPAHDIYALGIIIGYMWLGYACSWQYPPNKDLLPEKYADMVRKMINSDPKQRPSAIDILKELFDIKLDLDAPKTLEIQKSSESLKSYYPQCCQLMKTTYDRKMMLCHNDIPDANESDFCWVAFFYTIFHNRDKYRVPLSTFGSPALLSAHGKVLYTANFNHFI